ncbi:MAG: dienelactone hydrolase [Rhizobacter sp.]|nr:dienelactone hydrolase [Rhizobacter sp.]
MLRSFALAVAVAGFAGLPIAAAPAPAAQAGWRAITVPGLVSDPTSIPVNLYYPTHAEERSIVMGPYVAHVAPQAAPAPTFKGLIVISHGKGGAELNHESLAEALAREGYLVAALRHPGDNWQDHSLFEQGPTAYLSGRPRQVSRVLDAILDDPLWRDRIAKDARGPRVGALGHSAGGYTVLALAGGRFDLRRLAMHCGEHRTEDPILCAKTNPNAPQIAASSTVRAAPTLADPRVRAVVALAPLAVVFDAGSLERIDVPVAIYAAAQDRWLQPRFHAEWVASHVPDVTLHVVPNAWHFAFVDTPSGPIPSEDGDLRDDPPGFDRQAFLRELQRDVPAFFDAAFAVSATRH